MADVEDCGTLLATLPAIVAEKLDFLLPPSLVRRREAMQDPAFAGRRARPRTLGKIATRDKDFTADPDGLASSLHRETLRWRMSVGRSRLANLRIAIAPTDAPASSMPCRHTAIARPW